jgi:hypothetical protein
LSAEKGSWSQSGDMCKDNPAGGSLFQECQPGTCKPELLKRAITGLTDDEATMWINGYVLRSSTMQYYGKLSGPGILRIPVCMNWYKNIRFVFVISELLHKPLTLHAIYCFVHVALNLYCLYFHNNLQM